MRGSIQCKVNNKGEKFYHVVFPVGTQRKWIPGGRTLKAAEKVLSRELPRFQHGAYDELKKISFREFAELWLTSYAEGRVRDSTYRRYRALIDLHLVPFFGNFPLSSIKQEDIQKYLSVKTKDGQVSRATINRSRTVLGEMLRHAAQWNYLRENPVPYVKPLKENREEMDYLQPGEIEAFLKAIPQAYKPFFLIAILTGMRRGELLAMKWGNLDCNRKQYFVRESIYRGKLVEPKSETSKRAENVISGEVREFALEGR